MLDACQALPHCNDLVQTNCLLPRQGSGSPACAQGHTPCSAAPVPCTCFPFSSADAEPGAWRIEAALHHRALSLGSHTRASLPPQLQGSGGGEAMPPPSPHDCIDTSTERAGAPRALCGEGGREETLPPSPHNEPIVGGAGGGVGRVGQATEASSRGSRRRCQGLLLQGTLRLATLRLQCLKSPGWDGKITQGRSQKSKPHKKSTERRMGEHRRLLAG